MPPIVTCESGWRCRAWRVRFHTGGKDGCGGFQGLFHPEGDIAVIDLCYPGEFLALHELGHAWERFNLDDRRRADFERLTGSTTWRSTEVVWRERGADARPTCSPTASSRRDSRQLGTTRTTSSSSRHSPGSRPRASPRSSRPTRWSRAESRPTDPPRGVRRTAPGSRRG